MPQELKRTRISEDATVGNIATSLDSLSSAIKSIANIHGSLLQGNKMIVEYIQLTRKQRDVNLSTSEPSNDNELRDESNN